MITRFLTEVHFTFSDPARKAKLTMLIIRPKTRENRKQVYQDLLSLSFAFPAKGKPVPIRDALSSLSRETLIDLSMADRPNEVS